MLPYEQQVGKNPSIQKMKRCVVEQGIRPKFHQQWLEHEVSTLFLYNSLYFHI